MRQGCCVVMQLLNAHMVSPHMIKLLNAHTQRIYRASKALKGGGVSDWCAFPPSTHHPHVEHHQLPTLL